MGAVLGLAPALLPADVTQRQGTSLGQLALEHVHTRNMAVVIGLQSTGESNIGQAMEQMAANGEDIDDFVSAPAVILRNGEFIFIFVRTCS